MTTLPPKAQSTRPGIAKSILITIPMLLLTALVIMGSVLGGSGDPDGLLVASALLTWSGINVLFFLMVWTQKTWRWRAILFVVFALSMILVFSVAITSTRGSTTLTQEDVYNGETPFCHLVIPMILLPAALTNTIIFPGSMLEGFAAISFMLVLWIGASLVLGRAFCAWGCFYGGLDEGCSCIAKKPLIKKVDRKWTYLPWAILLIIVLSSAITLSPTYCEWLCPFKAVTEAAEVTSVITLIQTIIFLVIFAALVIILPILTKKRTQCSLFCPFGAFQSLTNKITIFDVRIDTEKCVGCNRCIETCPTYSLDENCLKTGHTLLSCTRCGKCVDQCPKQAIHFHVKGTAPHKRPNLARSLFLYPAFLFLATFGGGTIASAIYYILKLITTGSMF
ncbi:MAG TPA: 4Fe-4S binding protein [Anaerolineaceae bacterium]|nr:4Fe-4S binding protein [Anaerolineaceae bacterium]HPN51067.1 4Fe-4S binding protein [Anaerolineaceae bacterium]